MFELTAALLALSLFGFLAVSVARAVRRGELLQGGVISVSRLDHTIFFWNIIVWRIFLCVLSLVVGVYAFLAFLGFLGLVTIEV